MLQLWLLRAIAGPEQCEANIQGRCTVMHMGLLRATADIEKRDGLACTTTNQHADLTTLLVHLAGYLAIDRA